MKKFILLLVFITIVMNRLPSQFVHAAVPDENPDGRPWTLVVIPDTQHYTADWKKAPYWHMQKAFEWIVEKKEELNIKMVQGLGDITEDWDKWWQWKNGADAWGKLRGHVLYMPVIGNHDAPWRMNEFFPIDDFRFLPWFGDYYKGVENNYFLMTISGTKYMFLQLETFDPYTSDDQCAIHWANSVIWENHGAKVILATHDLWHSKKVADEVIAKHPNIILANAGHSCVREKWYQKGTAQVFIVDYQCDEYENFWLRYYTFYPKKNLVKFFTYSPVLDRFETDSNSTGEFSFDMD